MLEVIPRMIRSPSHTPSTFRISVEPKEMLFGVCVEHEYDWIMFISMVIHLSQRIIVVLFK